MLRGAHGLTHRSRPGASYGCSRAKVLMAREDRKAADRARARLLMSAWYGCRHRWLEAASLSQGWVSQCSGEERPRPCTGRRWPTPKTTGLPVDTNGYP